MLRPGAPLLAMALMVSGCSSGGDVAPPAKGGVDDAGRLAILDSSGDVIVMDPDGSNRIELTQDSGQDVVYAQPTWAPDANQLSFAQIARDGVATRVQAADAGEPTVVPMSAPPFYMSWSPDSEVIGVLHNGANGLDFEIVDVDAGTTSVVATGSPFYFSWEPTGEQVITHVGEDGFAVVGRDGSRNRLGDTDLGYLAPQWTSAGILHVSRGELVVQTENDEPTSVVGVGEFTVFVANPQGTLVAVQSVTPGGAISVSYPQIANLPTSVVVVVDLASGELEIVDGQPGIGFFWSPDGKSLLILSPTEDLEGVVPKVWTRGEPLVEYRSLSPSSMFVRDLIPFFPQYAQSMSLWAADSSGFAIPGTVDGENGIWVYGVETPEPDLVSDGVWISWSS